MTIVNGVVVEKPWYFSKKIWLLVLALGLALYQALTGKAGNETPADLVGLIVKTATWLGPILTTILAIAHVDGKTRAAAILGDAMATAEELDKPDGAAPVATMPRAAILGPQ